MNKLTAEKRAKVLHLGDRTSSRARSRVGRALAATVWLSGLGLLAIIAAMILLNMIAPIAVAIWSLFR